MASILYLCGVTLVLKNMFSGLPIDINQILNLINNVDEEDKYRDSTRNKISL